VTHELKTPINVIMGNIQLGEEGILGELTPRQRNAFATMRRNAMVLKRRVQRLLDVSQFEAGAGKIELSRIDLEEFLEGVEASFTVIGQERKIAFLLTRPETLPAEVVWDHDRMSEVLDNLLSNAFKFTPSGGAVELRVDAPGTNVRFDVRDTGAGIPSSQLPHLFRRFYQADNQEKASAKGTGLGLAITKEIVEAHGGTISVESTVAVGTTFTVILPAVVTTEHASTRVRRFEAVSSSPSSTSSTPSQGS
jgi:signal transduction histidine kinase